MTKAVDKPDKWARFIAQLIERTQDNRVQWSSYIPKQIDGPMKVAIVYQTKYQDKALRLFQSKPNEQYVEPTVWFPLRPRLQDEVVLKIVDEQQNDIWRFPESPALADLLSAVRYQVAKVDEFLNGILEQ